jgi:hypothetical protein
MSNQNKIKAAAKSLEEAKDGCLETVARSDWQAASRWAARLVEAAKAIEDTINDDLLAKP